MYHAESLSLQLKQFFGTPHVLCERPLSAKKKNMSEFDVQCSSVLHVKDALKLNKQTPTMTPQSIELVGVT